MAFTKDIEILQIGPYGMKNSIHEKTVAAGSKIATVLQFMRDHNLEEVRWAELPFLWILRKLC